MNWKKRLTNYNFWISIVSAILLILQAFDISFDIAYINEIVTAVLGLLVVIGIINDPTKTNKDITSYSQSGSVNKETKTEENTIENNKTQSETESHNEKNIEQINTNIETIESPNIDIPTQKENKNYILDSENNYEVFVNKIYSDLNEMKTNLGKLYANAEGQIIEKNLKNKENDKDIQENSIKNVKYLENSNNLTEKIENFSNNENDIKNNVDEQINEINIENVNSFPDGILSDSIENSDVQTAFKIVND